MCIRNVRKHTGKEDAISGQRVHDRRVVIGVRAGRRRGVGAEGEGVLAPARDVKVGQRRQGVSAKHDFQRSHDVIENLRVGLALHVDRILNRTSINPFNLMAQKKLMISSITNYLSKSESDEHIVADILVIVQPIAKLAAQAGLLAVVISKIRHCRIPKHRLELQNLKQQTCIRGMKLKPNSEGEKAMTPRTILLVTPSCKRPSALTLSSGSGGAKVISSRCRMESGTVTTTASARKVRPSRAVSITPLMLGSDSTLEMKVS